MPRDMYVNVTSDSRASGSKGGGFQIVKWLIAEYANDQAFINCIQWSGYVRSFRCIWEVISRNYRFLRNNTVEGLYISMNFPSGRPNLNSKKLTWLHAYSVPNVSVGTANKPRKARILLGRVTAREVLRVCHGSCLFWDIRWNSLGYIVAGKFNQRTNRSTHMVTVAS